MSTENQEGKRDRIELAKGIIQNAPNAIRAEFHRAANSWFECFGSCALQIQGLFSEKELGTPRYHELLDKLAKAYERLYELKQVHPEKDYDPPEEVKAELFRLLNIFE
ncbi:MAG: hypothetical protein A3I44_01660 [Candidatus Sungbacteria bacterium RIFCSPLOWO2_02_FULL_51_17]|uniref:HEPN domain-containing protein n=1 Tax=Candidatus Sungbacteria bacterium RIFCSPHIGHO2_02_FULL_51_29 TaxID=1802273 RepID=A0A1G2KPK6_9BACT|nr:MAG: hypothetical protein A2676_03290 [Candidatus Sungbacteria bacterium RIFCSPHIGHO2_01_FULL_51_22]OHA01337.1 MAG: hypothetical protein A3C16_01335 [Candidatus Sungbacteria bacterium RIFCSPHIGHO2_02_FULL_51_29]OHA12641.1 MAG: hypothetical protein A3I44_01660 [Candidatus Sungbacteria bacterium RIFCSPLOWO2_02_FULL_51_17]